MKKQKHNTTKTSFLTKFKNTKIGFKIIIIGGILALVATTIVVPIVVTSKGDSSNPKPNVDNRENDNNEDDNKQDDNKQDDNKQDDNKQDDNKQDDNNEDDNKQDDNNEDNNQQEKTDSYVPWHEAYLVDVTDATPSQYDYINDEISTTDIYRFGNQSFKVLLNYISTIGINKDEVLKNKANDKIVGTFIKFLGYDFGTSKTFANVFYQLKEDSAKWYYETIRIIGFGKPKIVPSDAATIASEEFGNFVLHKDFNVSSDLSSIGNYAFKYASFTKGAKFSLAQTQVKSIVDNAFASAKLPNGFALSTATSSIGQYAFQSAIFDKEAKFSLAQTQVKSISNSAFASATLPNAFALNPATNSIGIFAFNAAIFDKEAKFSLAETQVKSISAQAFASAALPNAFALNDETISIETNSFRWVTFDKDAKFSLAQTQVKSIPSNAFYNAKLPNSFALNPATTLIATSAFARAHLNPEFKIPNTVTSIAQDAFQGAVLPSGYAWYDKDGNKQTITATNYPKAGWYIGKI